MIIRRLSSRLRAKKLIELKSLWQVESSLFQALAFMDFPVTGMVKFHIRIAFTAEGVVIS